MFWKKGWIEKLNSGKDSSPLLMDYRVVPAAEASALLKDPNYSKTSFHHSGIVNMMARLLHFQPEELLEGRVAFCSQEPLKPGNNLEVQMKILSYNCKLKFIVETLKVDFQAEMKEMVFSTGMRILAVNKTDMDFLGRVIEAEKKRSAQ
jgi:hypothetical protein